MCRVSTKMHLSFSLKVKNLRLFCFLRKWQFSQKFPWPQKSWLKKIKFQFIQKIWRIFSFLLKFYFFLSRKNNLNAGEITKRKCPWKPVLRVSGLLLLDGLPSVRENLLQDLVGWFFASEGLKKCLSK